jgi:hypothetical protein
MDLNIDLTRAQTRHPKGVDAITTKLNERLKKAKMALVKADDIDWSYSWAVILGRGGDRMDNVMPGLVGKLDKRSANFPFFTPGSHIPMARADLPIEILEFYNQPKILVDPLTTPYAAVFDLASGKGTEKSLAVDGYRTKKATYIRYKVVGDEDKSFMCLLEVNGSDAIWSGALVRTAEERLTSTAPGAVFRYRNKPLTRLTTKEIDNLVGGQILTLTL